MANGRRNKLFIETVNNLTRIAILYDISTTYGITSREALDEITDDEAEHLLDYMTPRMRAGVSVLMQKAGLA